MNIAFFLSYSNVKGKSMQSNSKHFLQIPLQFTGQGSTLEMRCKQLLTNNSLNIFYLAGYILTNSYYLFRLFLWPLPQEITKNNKFLIMVTIHRKNLKRRKSNCIKLLHHLFIFIQICITCTIRRRSTSTYITQRLTVFTHQNS